VSEQIQPSIKKTPPSRRRWNAVTRGLEILAGRGCFRCRWRGGRNEHFIESIAFQSKYPIYHLFLALSERCPKVFAVNKRTCL
jgi:hypothetical protein